MLLKSVPLLGALVSSSFAADFNATCNDDNTLTLSVPFDREAEILEINYGSCTKDSFRADDLAQDPSDFSFTIVMDLAVCEMDSTVRTIELVQRADLRIGRSSVEIGTGDTHELSFATFDLDSYCSLTDTYEVVFDYGNLTVYQDKFEDEAGNVTLVFDIKAYNQDYSQPDFAHSTIAGNHIYLGITISSVFNYDEREFAPERCTFHDLTNGFQYTMFLTTVSGGCENEDVELDLSYNADDHMWRMRHVLFLLGDFDESTFQLKCTMKVCTISEDSICDDIRVECGEALLGDSEESSSNSESSDTEF
jgi:hypothetical protein